MRLYCFLFLQKKRFSMLNNKYVFSKLYKAVILYVWTGRLFMSSCSASRLHEGELLVENHKEIIPYWKDLVKKNVTGSSPLGSHSLLRLRVSHSILCQHDWEWQKKQTGQRNHVKLHFKTVWDDSGYEFNLHSTRGELAGETWQGAPYKRHTATR